MVAKKSNIKNIDENGRTPLLNFIIDEELELINTALDEHSWDAFLPDKYGRNALHYILMIDTKKSASIVRNLTYVIIDIFHKNDLNQTDDQGLTALHYACIHNKYREITTLLEKGAHHNIKDNTGKTALHYASMYGSVKSLQNLLLYGTDANVVDNDNNTPLHLACIRNNSTTIDCMKLLLCENMTTPIICHANKSGKTAIHLACIYLNDAFTFAYALHTLSMIDINELDLENRSALHYALILHNYDFVKIILLRDAYIDYTDDYIHMCLNSNVPYEDNKNIVKLLMLYFYDQCNKDHINEILADILLTDSARKYFLELKNFHMNMNRSMSDVFEGECNDDGEFWLSMLKVKDVMYPLYGDMLIAIMENLTLNENEIG